jgi:AcrR family transcriptional regulator
MSRRSPSEARVQIADPGPTQQLRERVRRDTTLAIASAAEAIFAAEGLYAAHVEDIARRAGVAVGTLYNYYKDRDALLAALLRLRRDAFHAEVDAALEATQDRTVREQIEAFVRVKVSFLARHPTFFRILFDGELTRMRASYPTAAAEHAQAIDGFFDRIVRLVERAILAGEIRGGHADLDAWMLGGMIRSISVREFRANRPCQPEDVDHIIDVFWRGAGS